MSKEHFSYKFPINVCLRSLRVKEFQIPGFETVVYKKRLSRHLGPTLDGKSEAVKNLDESEGI